MVDEDGPRPAPTPRQSGGAWPRRGHLVDWVRRLRRGRPPGWRRWTRRLRRAALVLVGGAFATVVIVWFITPSTGDVQQRATRYAASRGAGLLAPGETPALLRDAVVATEDERFFEHHGVDVLGVARALVDDVRRLCLCEGGSTITEQLVKEIYLGGSDRGINKLVDVALALKVERTINKQQILADYLSIVPTGPRMTGVETAACRYFHRRLESLN
ncbi:MAG: biosynthetic peptidoglycan transglycosylase, partial [Candidatus Dormibacteria bacterium]